MRALPRLPPLQDRTKTPFVVVMFHRPLYLPAKPSDGGERWSARHRACVPQWLPAAWAPPPARASAACSSPTPACRGRATRALLWRADFKVGLLIRPIWEPVFKAASVDLVLYGHFHVYSRTALRGGAGAQLQRARSGLPCLGPGRRAVGVHWGAGSAARCRVPQGHQPASR